jgi:hypothetical protein
MASENLDSCPETGVHLILIREESGRRVESPEGYVVAFMPITGLETSESKARIKRVQALPRRKIRFHVGRLPCLDGPTGKDMIIDHLGL